MLARPDLSSGSIEDEETDSDTVNITPTGANNPFNYEVDDGEVQGTTLGGNTVADVVDSIDYSDTSVNEQEMTSDEPQSTDDIINEHSGEDTPDNPENNPDDSVIESGDLPDVPGAGFIPDGLPSGMDGLKYIAAGFVGLIAVLGAIGLGGEY
jgi:hypothetical protein